FKGLFADYNLYDNDFNKTLSLLAYTGYGSIKQQGFISSPEFTTNGMLAKAWRKDPLKRKGIFLYKSGSKGCANCGNEPYSEFYASQIAKVMGLDFTSYSLAKWKGEVNSICQLFSSKEYAFIPIYRLVTEGGWDAVLAYYADLGDAFYEALLEMIIFDVIIVNVDRHFGNFGLLIDTKSNTIVKLAPIFDNGLSLFYDATDDDLSRVDDFARTKSMKNAGDFMTFAASIMTPELKKKVKKLINFRFERHSMYNLPAKRLRLIEGFIQRRVSQLLE
ncbi:MAG TPA: XRE family transcriptional regulator, partial [Arcobacter sp.]|nr:XRE family transcriptional regulator [Arcobacter sp.]